MAKDIYHEAVRKALIKEGWTITHDPLYLPVGRRKVFVDLGADAPIGAERAGEKIAVEIKSFLGPSEMAELERALGQLVIYRYALESEEPDRVLYLAIAEKTYSEVFDDRATQEMVERVGANLILFDPQQEAITQWIE